MFKKFFDSSKYYLLTFLVLLLTFIFIKVLFGEYLLTIETNIHDYILNINFNNYITLVFKCITNMGSFIFYLGSLIIIYFINKNIFKISSISLISTFFLSIIYKNIIMRSRPISALITIPNDYSFPSGHTFNAVVFYGVLVYVINKMVKNKKIRIILNIVLSSIIILIGASRIYLGVHFVTDVLAGYLLGFIVLKMFIKFYNKYNLI